MMWRRRDEWCLYKRMNLLTRGNNTNNYMEASIRIFKDVVLQRSKVFNACALVLFITDKFEMYHKLRLLEFANSRRNKDLIYSKFLKRTERLCEFIQMNENQYKVNSETNPNVFHTVQTDIAFCDCPEGKSGSFCRHLCALEQKYSIIFKTSPRITKSERIELAKIALGTEDLPETFFSEVNDMTEDAVASTLANFPRLSAYDNNETAAVVIRCEDNLESKQRFADRIQETKSQFSRMSDLMEDNYTPNKLIIMTKFLNTIKSIETEDQAVSFMAAKIQALRSKKIKVQPTSISRRKNRDISKGNNRIQSGRPANTENKKRAHCLSQSISLNRPNAKKH